MSDRWAAMYLSKTVSRKKLRTLLERTTDRTINLMIKSFMISVQKESIQCNQKFGFTLQYTKYSVSRLSVSLTISITILFSCNLNSYPVLVYRLVWARGRRPDSPLIYPVSINLLYSFRKWITDIIARIWHIIIIQFLLNIIQWIQRKRGLVKYASLYFKRCWQIHFKFFKNSNNVGVRMDQHTWVGSKDDEERQRKDKNMEKYRWTNLLKMISLLFIKRAEFFGISDGGSTHQNITKFVLWIWGTNFPFTFYALIQFR